MQDCKRTFEDVDNSIYNDVGWKWNSEWCIVKNDVRGKEMCDEDGWMYSIDFIWKFSPKQKFMHVVRKRYIHMHAASK